MNTDLLQKAELHCHSDGIVNSRMLDELRAIRIPAAVPGLPGLKPSASFDEWMKLLEFKEANGLNDPEFIREVMRLHLVDLARQNVTYSEIMLTGLVMKAPGLEATIELVGRYTADIRTGAPIDVNFLIVIGRTKNRARITEQIRRIIALHERGIIAGMALVGDEHECTIAEYRDLFDALHEAGVPVEIHAGEWCDASSVCDAVNFGHPRRIGHGCAAFADRELIERIIADDIHLEFCVSSNAALTEWREPEKHPIMRAKALGMNFSINTDDPGDFGCSMNGEYRLLAERCGFTGEDFNRVYNNTLRSAFGQSRSTPRMNS